MRMCLFLSWGCALGLAGCNTDGTGTGTETGIGTDTETDGETTDSEDLYLMPPDCDSLDLPGIPEDLSATPRPDRDAEILALRITPDAIVASQPLYTIIAGDLEAIRALDPTLDEVHAECDDPVALDFYDFSVEVVHLVWSKAYQAWDCHNEHYGADDIWRTDGYAFRVTFDGVVGESIVAPYASLPGFEEIEIFRACRAGSPCGENCREDASAIDLEVFEDGGSGPRQYRWVHADGGGESTYRVEPGQPPELVG